MKRIYTTIAFCFLINLLFAQNERYDFSSSNEVYVPLTNGEEFDFDPTADFTDFEESLELEVELGFSVPVLGIPAEEILSFLTPAFLVTSFDDEIEDPIFPFLVPTTTQLQNRGAVTGTNPSQVFFETSGDVGSQVFMLEYRNFGFANEFFLSPPTQDMFTNMQIWIYEATGCIEFRYGESNITDEELIFDEDEGSAAGLFRALGSQLSGDTVLYGIFTMGDAQNPSSFEGENTDEVDGSSAIGFPEDGVVYSFCPETAVSTTDLNSSLKWEVYPNPTLDFLKIKVDENITGNFQIVAMNGQTIHTGIMDLNNNQVDVSNLSSGIYMLTLTTENGIATKRFWKK